MDQLKKITMEGYRLFKEERSVEFSTPSNTTLGLNIIVGSNNVGKSSLVNLIGANYWNQINREDWSTDAPKITVECDGKKVIVQYNKNSINPQNTQDPEGQWPNITSMYLPSDRRWAFEAANVNLGPGMYMSQPNPSDADLIQQFTNVAQMLSGSYASNQNFEAQKKPTEQFIGTLLFISQSDTLKDKYGELVREFIPNYQNYDLLRRRGNKYQVLYRSADTSEYIDMALVGDGVQTIMVICAYLLLIREGHSAVPGGGAPAQSISMLVMDEPETSLHPQAQKKLFSYIKELSKSVQIIYATHSPYMVSWDVVDQGGRIIRIDSHDGKQADIHTLSHSLQSDIKFATQPRRRSNIDAISREIVFTDKVLIVEGLDDANILRAYTEQGNLGYNYEICGHGADGAGSIIKWLKVAAALGIKGAAIYDHDSVADFDAAKAAFGETFVKQWSTDDIRDKKGCPDCSKGAKTGLFTDKGTVKEDSKAEVDKILGEINIALNS